jgi:biotin carboxyl carrier protein
VAKETVRLRSGERDVQAITESDASGTTTVSIDHGEPFLVQATEPGVYHVTQGEQIWRAFAVTQGGKRWVFVDGRVAIVDVCSGASALKGSRTGSTGPQSLTAPMPATVVKIMASENQRVKKGDTLLLLEAMKMELPVRAPADGVVKKLLCTEGELVQPDTQLIEFE